MFKRIDHIELVTAEPERAIRFYTEVLGFKVRRRDAVPTTPLAKGVEPAWGPIRREAYVRAEIRDPDGNAIELREWTV
jgi:hypothetical protein